MIRKLNLNKQSGVSLIEILVTTLILGIGLLGVAALQVSSISGNQEGFYTSQATSIAEDFASRIRTSKISSMVYYRPAAATYTTYVASYADANSFACAGTAPKQCNDASNACSSAELKENDKWEICQVAQDTLPDGKVKVGRLASSNRLSVVVDWASTTGRKDTGEKQIVNANCSAITGSMTRNCVIMEIMP